MERAHGKTINRGDAFARQNIRRSAGSHDPPILHEENRIGIAGGKIDVVHGKDDALALLRGNTASRCQHLPPDDGDPGCWWAYQEQPIRLLNKSAGPTQPSALPSGKVGKRTLASASRSSRGKNRPRQAPSEGEGPHDKPRFASATNSNTPSGNAGTHPAGYRRACGHASGRSLSYRHTDRSISPEEGFKIPSNSLRSVVFRFRWDKNGRSHRFETWERPQ